MLLLLVVVVVAASRTASKSTLPTLEVTHNSDQDSLQSTESSCPVPVWPKHDTETEHSGCEETPQKEKHPSMARAGLPTCDETLWSPGQGDTPPQLSVRRGQPEAGAMPAVIRSLDFEASEYDGSTEL